MTIQITIVGLGEIGTSLGLALKYQKDEIRRVGCDIRKYAEENAMRIEAVDEIQHAIVDAVKAADIVFLAIPANEVESVLELIADEVKQNAAILDCSAAKISAIGWAQTHLRQPNNYLGIYPSISAKWLHEHGNEYHSAHEDLFKTGIFFIAPSPDTDPSVVKLAADLAQLVGSHSIYIEPAELDGLISFNDMLPKILSNAFYSSAINLNSWQEARKLGSKEFVALTDKIAAPRTAKQLAFETMENRENILRSIHHYMQTLKEYRDALLNRDNAALQSFYEKNLADREQWLKDYESGNWRREQDTPVKPPSMGDYLGQMFLGGLARKKKE